MGSVKGLIVSAGAVAKPVDASTTGVIAELSGATSVVNAGVSDAGGTETDTVEVAAIAPLVAVIV